MLALASDGALAAAAIDVLPAKSPLHAIATGRSAAADREDASHLPPQVGRRLMVTATPPSPGARWGDSRSAAALAASRIKNAVSQAVAAVARGRHPKAGLGGHVPTQHQRFSVQRESAPGASGGGGNSGRGAFVLLVQPATPGGPAAGSVPGKSRRKHAHPDVVADTSPRDLRSSTLSLLLESNPVPFPAVTPSFLSTGALTIGATNLQQRLHTEQQPSSPAAPFPRLAAVLRLDTVAALAIVGRLFTAAADAVKASVRLTEGLPGFVARHRCLPGEWPALAAPAGLVELRIQAPKVDTDQRPDATPLKDPPTLQAMLQAIAEIALSMAVSEASSTRPVGVGAAAFRRGGAQQSLSAQADALDLSASAVSPRLGLLLLFVAFQICRTGPGLPPVVLDVAEAAAGSRAAQGAIASAVRLAALYLCSPAPLGKKVANGSVSASAGGGTGTSSVLSDSSWILHDDVVDLIVSFTGRRASTPVAAAWDVHSDDELFSWPDARDEARPAASPTALSRREELLVRLLRSVPLSSELRAVLAVRASAAGQFAALAVLRALDGDAVAVIDAFLQVRLRGCTLPNRKEGVCCNLLYHVYLLLGAGRASRRRRRGGPHPVDSQPRIRDWGLRVCALLVGSPRSIPAHGAAPPCFDCCGSSRRRGLGASCCLY